MIIRKTIGVSHMFVFLFVLWSLAGFVLRPSIWFTVDRVAVLDAPTGVDIPMDVTRTIKRNFTGEYRVEVRSFSGYTVACEAQGKVDYSPKASFPEPLTLTWWGHSDPRCGNLPIGRYSIKTTWEIERLWGFLPDGVVVATSNFFTVGKSK